MRAADYRARIATAVVAALRDDPAIAAIAESGAAARGRADEFSDLDLMIVAPLADAAAIFDRTEQALRRMAPIEHTWRVEAPSFPGLAQRFYFLAGAPRHFAVDCSVVSQAGIEPFLERERHGEPVVWFDRAGLLQARPADQAALARRRTQRREQLRGAVPVYAMLVDKELERGHALEALYFHQVLLRALIDLLGMRERPDRFDFGWRYVGRELSTEAQALIARHAFVPDAAALLAVAASLASTVRALLASFADDPDTPAAVSAAAPGDRPSR
jgi:predicted nucleotidyltransferase